MLGLVGALVGIGSLAGSLAAGPLVDWWSRRGVTCRCSTSAGACCSRVALAVATTASSWQLALAGFVLAFFSGTGFFSSAQVYLTTVMAERRGAAVSWNNSVLYVGSGAGTAVLGLTALGGQAFAALSVVFALCTLGFSARLAWARPVTARFQSR